MRTQRGLLTIAFTAAALGLASAPAFSQGNGNRPQKSKGNVEEQRNRPEIYTTSTSDRTGEVRQRGNGSGKIPPGWCQGVGNPHNTPENCGYTRNSPRGEPSGRGGSYEESHARFHQDLDYRYDRLAAERPLDIRYQLDLQARKRAEHDEWHRRMGTSH